MNNKWLLGCLLAVALIPAACKTPKLQSGGAYAPTNNVGQVVVAPDLTFYQVDAAFDLAFSTIQAVFKFEYDNRTYLWGLSPQIKKTLDGIRPDTVDAIRNYAIARAAYMSSPTPAGLNTLNTILAKTQQLAVTAQAVTQNLLKGQ